MTFSSKSKISTDSNTDECSGDRKAQQNGVSQQGVFIQEMGSEIQAHQFHRILDGTNLPPAAPPRLSLLGLNPPKSPPTIPPRPLGERQLAPASPLASASLDFLMAGQGLAREDAQYDQGKTEGNSDEGTAQLRAERPAIVPAVMDSIVGRGCRRSEA